MTNKSKQEIVYFVQLQADQIGPDGQWELPNTEQAAEHLFSELLALPAVVEVQRLVNNLITQEIISPKTVVAFLLAADGTTQELSELPVKIRQIRVDGGHVQSNMMPVAETRRPGQDEV